MDYIKIKVSFKDAKNKLYRTLLVRKDIYLFVLGLNLASLFKTKFEHMFYFIDHLNNIEYVDSSWLVDRVDDNIQSLNYKREDFLKALEKSNNNLTYIYDSGEYYEFNVKQISKKVYQIPLLCNVLLVDAKGDGIWEDNKYGLLKFLSGKAKPSEMYSNGEKLKKDYDFYPKFDYDEINTILMFGQEIFEKWSDIITGETFLDDDEEDYNTNDDIDGQS